jgi:hypothetical protein
MGIFLPVLSRYICSIFPPAMVSYSGISRNPWKGYGAEYGDKSGGIMKQELRNKWTLWPGILVVLVGLSLMGTVAAGTDMMDNCPIADNGNGTTGYGPGMMAGYGQGYGGVPMMESAEVSAMGGPVHDEMQGLITRMQAGGLNTTDRARMIEIMNRYPGASDSMITRMVGGYGQGSGWGAGPGMMGSRGYYGNGMMGNGYGPGMTGGVNPWFMILGCLLALVFFIVWLVAGILLVIWLVRQLQSDKKSP